MTKFVHTLFLIILMALVSQLVYVTHFSLSHIYYFLMSWLFILLLIHFACLFHLNLFVHSVKVVTMNSNYFVILYRVVGKDLLSEEVLIVVTFLKVNIKVFECDVEN